MADPAVLLRQLVGTDPSFQTEEVAEFIRESVVARVATALADFGVVVLDPAAHQNQVVVQLCLRDGTAMRYRHTRGGCGWIGDGPRFIPHFWTRTGAKQREGLRKVIGPSPQVSARFRLSSGINAKCSSRVSG